MKLAKFLLALFVGATVIFGGLFVNVSPAHAADGDEEIVQHIIDQVKGSSVSNPVLIHEATITNRELIKDANFKAYATIVVVSLSDLKGYPPQEIADFIIKNRGYTNDYSFALLVVNRGATSEIYVATNSEGMTLELIDVLGEVNANGAISTTDPGWLIVKKADEIKSVQDAYDTFDDGAVMAVVFGCIFGIPILGIIIWVLWNSISNLLWSIRLFFRNKKAARIARKKARASAKKKASEERAAAAEARKREETRPSPGDNITRDLAILSKKVLKVKDSDKALHDNLTLFLSRFNELRDAMILMEIPPHERDKLFLEYEHIFRQIATIVGPKYYGDMLKNPDHWNDTETKLDGIRRAVGDSAEEILKNIRQLKEGTEIEFTVALESLLGFKVKDPRDMIK